MKGKRGDEWYPFWVDKWLFGSTRLEFSHAERAIWIDLLTLSKKDNGFVRANIGVPYPLEQLAGMFRARTSLVLRTITKAISVNKLERQKDGTLFVCSTGEYELTNRHKRRIKMDTKTDTMSEKADIMSESADIDVAESRVEESRIEKKNIYKKKKPSKEEFLQYIKENKLNIQNPEGLYAGYADGGWIDTQGKPVKNWQLKLRTLHNFAQKEKEGTKQKLLPIVGKICSERGCGMPAVYKWSSAAGYDFWSCSKHLPEKVKEKYE